MGYGLGLGLGLWLQLGLGLGLGVRVSETIFVNHFSLNVLSVNVLSWIRKSTTISYFPRGRRI